jgi:hypothetical protein
MNVTLYGPAPSDARSCFTELEWVSDAFEHIGLGIRVQTSAPQQLAAPAAATDGLTFTPGPESSAVRRVFGAPMR